MGGDGYSWLQRRQPGCGGDVHRSSGRDYGETVDTVERPCAQPLRGRRGAAEDETAATFATGREEYRTAALVGGLAVASDGHPCIVASQRRRRQRGESGVGRSGGFTVVKET
ncbi:non-ribosomal peptide synthetase [Sesbania bispinosa]|nr:non-ribosomal peptide synthetase [Sesbania bispinosa]